MLSIHYGPDIGVFQLHYFISTAVLCMWHYYAPILHTGLSNLPQAGQLVGATAGVWTQGAWRRQQLTLAECLF